MSKFVVDRITPKGIRVRQRSGTKMVYPALCCRWFSDRDGLVKFLQKEYETLRTRYLRRADKMSSLLAGLPAVLVEVVPPAVRAEHDTRDEL